MSSQIDLRDLYQYSLLRMPEGTVAAATPELNLRDLALEAHMPGCYCEAIRSVEVLVPDHCLISHLFTKLTSGDDRDAWGVELFLTHQDEHHRTYDVAEVTARLPDSASPELFALAPPVRARLERPNLHG